MKGHRPIKTLPSAHPQKTQPKWKHPSTKSPPSTTATRNPAPSTKTSPRIRPVLDRLLDRLRASGFKSSSHIKDIERARDVLADALVKFQENPFGDSKIGPYEPNDPSATFYSKPQDGKGGGIDEVVERFHSDPDSADALAFKEWLEGGFWDIQDGKRPEAISRIHKVLESIEPFRTRAPIYRGIRFWNEADREKFVSGFAGRTWINKRPFMSATKERSIAFEYAENSAYPVYIAIRENRSGRDISRIASLLSKYGWQKEILFSRGAVFEIHEVKKIVYGEKVAYAIVVSELENE